MPEWTVSARVDVLGVGISAVDMARTVETIASWVESRSPNYVCVTSVHGVMESVRDPELRRIHNQSGLSVPDGMPLVWCAHRAGARDVGRVSGADLMLRLAREAASKGWRSFFYGAGEGVAEKLAQTLADAYPGFTTVGTYSPPFRLLTAQEDDAVVAMINRARPDLVWVGLSTPKQERWMAEHIDRLEAPVLLGVGAAFDINAGLVPRAPVWMQRSSLEWLFRVGVEPRRLWRRYLRNNPSFAIRVLARPPTLIAPPGAGDS